MKWSSFQQFASRYAAAMGSSRKVRVTFGGTMAYAAPGILNIPALPAGTVMSPWQVKVFSGYVDHELGHHDYTDFNAFDPKKLKDPNSKYDPLLKYLLNVFEDIRIENARIAFLPGTRTVLDALAVYCDTDPAMAQRDSVKLSSLDLALQLIYKEAYKTYRNIDTKFTIDDISKHKELEEVQAEMAKLMPHMKNTNDALTLAKNVHKILKGKVQEGALKQPDPMAPELQQLLQDLFDWLIKNIKVKDSHEQKEGAIKVLTKDIVEENKGLIGNVKTPSKSMNYTRNAAGSQVLPPATTDHDNLYRYPHEDMAQYLRVRASIAGEVNAIKKMLNIFLRTRAKKAWSRGLEEGVLDTEALHLFAVGRHDLMKEKRESSLTDTAVEMMLDLSSSMNDSIVRMSAICVCEAINDIPKIKLEVAGFTTNYHHDYNAGPTVGRSCGIDIMLFKGFDEPYTKAKGHLGAIKTSGGTPLGDAYGHALERLILRKEKRKILWVTTDGDPAYAIGSGSPHCDYLMMAQLKAKAAALGIETVVLDIGGSRSKPYFKYHANVNQISDLPTALMATLKGAIL